ncbi:MAG: hypothetical protein GF320_12530 [Armatimonadia bacterium]|nr:hypothetical protein [Armatimonadia bacterium]
MRTSAFVMALVGLVCAAGQADEMTVVWDPGEGLDGSLNPGPIVPITGSGVVSAEGIDRDEYVVYNAEMEQVGQGTALDELDWGAWTCNGNGSIVLSGTSTTTWTAPAEGGLYGISVFLEDLPTPIGDGDSGSRDDSPIWVTFETADDRAIAVECTSIQVQTDTGELEGSEAPFGPLPEGDDIYTTDPGDAATGGRIGFFKRAEVRGTIHPALPDGRSSYGAGAFFIWVQEKRGEVIHNGATVDEFANWTGDSPSAAFSDTNPLDDPNNRIQMLDAPGFASSWTPLPITSSHTHEWWGPNLTDPFHFRNAVWFKGVRISDGWDDQPEWVRRLYLETDPPDEIQWQVIANN